MKAMFVCSYPHCGKAYVNNSILKRHMQAFHTSVKRFQCSSCGKCLASRQNLKEHSYIHTGEKPYACPFLGCRSAFRQGTHLSAHKRLEHPDRMSFKKLDSKFITDPSCCFPDLPSPEVAQHQDFSFSAEMIELPQIRDPYTCKLPNIFETFHQEE